MSSVSRASWEGTEVPPEDETQFLICTISYHQVFHLLYCAQGIFYRDSLSSSRHLQSHPEPPGEELGLLGEKSTTMKLGSYLKFPVNPNVFQRP